MRQQHDAAVVPLQPKPLPVKSLEVAAVPGEQDPLQRRGERQVFIVSASHHSAVDGSKDIHIFTL